MKKIVFLMMTALLLLLPFAMQAQYISEGFESTNTSTTPTGWTQMSGTVQVSTSYVCTGSHSLKFSGTTRNIVALPALPVEISTVELTMNTRPESTYSSSGQFDIGYVTSISDTSTFVTVATYSYSDFDGCGEITATFVNAPTGSRIAFRHRPLLYNYYWFVDDVQVHDIPTCPKPTNPVAQNITSSTADFVWSSNASGSSWEVYMTSSANDIPTDTTTPTDYAYDTTYALTSLNPSTTYYFYVREDCGGGDVSLWSGCSFRTDCGDYITIPYTEDFESYGNNTFPYCWKRVSNNSYPYTYSYNTYEGLYSLYFYQSTYSNADTAYAILPAIDPSVTLDQLTVRFYMMGSSSYGSYVALGVLADTSDLTTFTRLVSLTPSDTWTEYEFNLASVTDTGRLAIRCDLGTSSYSSSLYLDNVQVIYTPSCPRIVSVSVIDSLTLQDGATICWVPGGTESSWDVQCVPSGQMPTDNDWYTVSIDTFYAFTGLTANTAYTAYVRANCGSEVSEPRSVNFRTACGSQAIPYYDDFESYSYGTSDFPACWTSLSGSSYIYNGSDSYGGSGNSLKIYGPGTVATPFIANNIDELQISFQLNREGSSSGSMVVGFTTSLTDLSNMVTIATIDPTTTHQMFRYEYNLNNIGTSDQGYIVFQQNSTSSNWYYWLDNIRIQEIPTCLAPTLSLDGFSGSSVTLKWTPNGDESSWNVVYGTGTFNPDTVTENVLQYLTDTFVTVDNLIAGQEYTFYVQADCGTETSLFSEAVTFTSGIFTIADFDTLYTCEGVLYDDGGATGSYGTSRNDQIVLFPATEGAAIQISGTLSSESDYDELFIYEGVGTSGRELYSGSGQNQVVPPVSSSTALTVVFTSDVSITYDGFALTVECLTCAPPNINVTDLGTDHAEITWDDQDGTQTNWEFVYGLSGFNINTQQPTSVSSNVQSLTGLTPNTLYDVYVRTICGADDTSRWSQPFTFTTLLGAPASLPYSCDFEDTVENNTWLLVNASSTNAWVIGTAVNNTNTGSTSLYVSNDSGVTNNYTITSYASVWACRDINFRNYGEYDLSFDWKAYGESNYDFIQVYIGTPNNPTAGTSYDSFTIPSGANLLIERLNLDTAWSTTHVMIDGNTYNGVYRLYFLWRNDGSGGSAPAGAIDNIRITGTNCLRPSNLAVSNVTTSSVDLTWHPGSDSDAQWEVAYSTDDGFNPDTVLALTATDTAYTLSGLTPSTVYYVYVRTNCGSGEVSAWSNVLSFQTECDAVAIPYSENFDSFTTNVMPICWSSLGTYTASTPYVYSYYHASSPNSLYMYSYGSAVYAMVVTPKLDELVDVNTLMVNFNLRAGSTSDKLIVGVLTDNTDASTFVPVDTFQVSATSTWENKMVFLNNYTGTGHYIGFKLVSNYGYSTYLDDIEIDLLPTCMPVSGVVATNITTTSADLIWHPNSETDSQWDVVYSTDANFDPDTAAVTTATDTLITLNGLTAATTYYAYVRTNCGAGDESFWSNKIMFQTECDEVTLPYAENFDNSVYGDLPLCWTSLGTYTTQPYVTSSYSLSSPYALYMYSYGSSVYAMVASPLLDETVNANTLMVDFNIRSGSSSDKMIVGVLTDNTDASTFVPVDTIQVSASSTWENHTVYLNNYTGIGHYIGFKLVSNYGYSTYLDDINIDVIPSCLPVADIAVSTVTSTSATLEWTEQGSATAWSIEYGPQGFTQGSGTTVSATTNPFTISNLTTGTAYDFYVKAECGPGDESQWRGPVSATPGSYNIPATGSYSVDMCGGTIYDDGGPDGSYSTNCNVTVVINPDQAGLFVQLNGTYSIETGSSARWDYLQIYDGNTTDGTILFDSHLGDTLTNITSTTGPLTLYFKSDASITYSGFEIQVSCVGGSIPETCNAPTNVAVSGLTHESAVVDWSQEGTPDSWTISYKKASASTWSTITTTTHPYTITNLEAETSYNVFVTANCGEATSEASSTVTFITLPNGVDDYELNSIVLFPNPTTGQFTIQNAYISIQNVEVYDVYGKLMTSVEVNDNTVVIDASSFASGVYFTRIFTEKGMVTKRIVKK